MVLRRTIWALTLFRLPWHFFDAIHQDQPILFEGFSLLTDNCSSLDIYSETLSTDLGWLQLQHVMYVFCRNWGMVNPQEQRRRHTRGTAGEDGETAKEEQERGKGCSRLWCWSKSRWCPGSEAREEKKRSKHTEERCMCASPCVQPQK